MVKRKRLVVISDLHSGHEYGLTPPEWWTRDDTGNEKVTKAGKFQRELWAFYTRAIERLKPIDILVVNGDAIEGKGEGSGGTELITADRHVQIQMAKEAIEVAEAKKVRILYGTRYHVGKEEDFESILTALITGADVNVEGHAYLDINSCKVDIKHKITGSVVPHGRMTAVARDRLWNVIWNSEHERQPKADIIIRSHVHYYNYGGGANWLAMITPALCYNSKHGIRECSGLVDAGFVFFDFDTKGNYTWRPILAEFAELKVRPEFL